MVPLRDALTPPEFREATPKDGPARFRAPGEALGFDDDLGRATEVFLTTGPAMWLRLMPVVDQQKRWPTGELLRVGSENSLLFPLRAGAGSYSYVRDSDGQGIYRLLPKNEERRDGILTGTVAFAFRTGEVWSVDAVSLSFDPKSLPYPDIQDIYVNAAERYRNFLSSLGVKGPYRWKAGLDGVKGRYLVYQPSSRRWISHRGPICAADQFESAGTLNDEQNTLEALLPFFEQIFEECGIERPDDLPKQ